MRNQIVRAFSAPTIAPAYDPAEHPFPRNYNFPGGYEVANSQEEWDEIVARRERPETSPEETRQGLIALAQEKGVKIDARWKLERIVKAIKDSDAGNNFTD